MWEFIVGKNVYYCKFKMEFKIKVLIEILIID